MDAYHWCVHIRSAASVTDIAAPILDVALRLELSQGGGPPNLGLVMDVNDLSDALRQIAENYWADHSRPHLLSALPRELSTRLGSDYKTLIGDESLKTFISRTGETSGYRLVEHPTQRAKLGIVPAGVDYTFETAEASSPAAGASREDVQAFARVLLSLSADERKSLTLPAEVVARLLLIK